MIHTFERGGIKMALDVGSGAVHVLEEPAFSVLCAVNEAELKTGKLTTDLSALPYPADALQACFDELAALAAADLLGADDSYREFQARLGLDEPIKAMCLHIAHDCNLRCKYCFASTGGFGGVRKLMPFEVAKEAIDLLVSVSRDRHNLEVDFFGGEPMMGFDVVQKTVEYARSIEKEHNKRFRFTITTNGLLLDDKNIEYINREMSNVVLSMDGRREVTDNMRKMLDGTSTFDAIVPRFQKLVESRGTREYYVRGTYTRDNLDFDRDVLALYDLGFSQISVEPVVGPETDSYSIRQQDVPAIEESYERLLAEMAKRRQTGENNFNFFHFMVDLDNGPCAIKRLKGCGSGNEYIAITPDGEIYPCHQFVGNTDFIMGDVWGGIKRADLKQTFADANLFQKPECMNCWAKFFCSGGCNANNHTFEGSIYNPHRLSCTLEKIRLECALALQALTMN